MKIEIGSRWKRRVQAASPDGWDLIVVSGIFEQSEGQTELVVRQAEGFGPVVSTTPAALQAAFDLERDAPPKAPEDLAATARAWIS